ncbi:flagellar basal body rod protein FlgB [Azonexus caeni]|jgi:flagellar basal-body rod protein FlgB|uniref:flagellar basal body rod protein FlgB n=1 Tax=Azonexus caeni TaxID=266126 RepID=UPI002C25E87E|nr:flagellar basal body rod protein FlgB [Azonexus sp.]
MANLESHLGVYSKALDLRAQRQQVLASNIANADTPNYKARDFDFSQAMAQAMAGRPSDGALPLARTSAGHLGAGNGAGSVRLQYRGEAQSAVDGNTVDMDVERAQIADNAIQYQILTQLISDKFSGLRTAMSGTQG